MNLLQRLAHNSLWLLIARVGAQASLVLVTFLLAHRLDVAAFGEYSFMAAVVTIGNTFTTFGSDMYLIREIAAKSEVSNLMSALVLQLSLSVLFIAAIFLVAHRLPNQTSESIQAVEIYSFALIPLAFFTVFTSALRGGQKMVAYAWLNLLIAVIQVIVIVLVVRGRMSLVIVAYWLLAVQTAGAIVGGVLCALGFPNFWLDWNFSFQAVENLFVACLPIACIVTLGILYQKLSLTLLSVLGSAALTGYYSAATRVLEAARLGHVAVFTALYPAMANTDKSSENGTAFRHTWIWLLALSSAEALGLVLLATPLVNIFFGTIYAPAIPVLRILILTLIPYTINTYLLLAFLVDHKEKTLILVWIVSVFILLILNLYLIPRMGSIGAGWSFLISESCQAVLLLLAWRINPLRTTRRLNPEKGVSNELSGLS